MVASSSDRRTLGASGFAQDLFELCARELESIGSLEAIQGDSDPRFALGHFDALLVVLAAPLSDSVDNFARLRRAHPLLPIVLLAEGVDANLATELLKCGAEDFLQLPPSPEALRRKLQRALGDVIGPAFDVPELAAFRPRDFDENQRHCYRVSVLPEFPVAGRFPGPVDRALEVKDLSIETDKGPGGMQVAADRTTARRLPFDQWNRRREIDISVQLPSGAPITTRARLIPGLRNAPDGSIRFAVEYWVSRPADKERFRRYWVEAQRRMRRVRK
jgi:CheY-like chemotaxis protein